MNCTALKVALLTLSMRTNENKHPISIRASLPSMPPQDVLRCLVVTARVTRCKHINATTSPPSCLSTSILCHATQTQCRPAPSREGLFLRLGTDIGPVTGASSLQTLYAAPFLRLGGSSPRSWRSLIFLADLSSISESPSACSSSSLPLFLFELPVCERGAGKVGRTVGWTWK